MLKSLEKWVKLGKWDPENPEIEMNIFIDTLHLPMAMFSPMPLFLGMHISILILPPSIRSTSQPFNYISAYIPGYVPPYLHSCPFLLNCLRLRYKEGLWFCLCPCPPSCLVHADACVYNPACAAFNTHASVLAYLHANIHADITGYACLVFACILPMLLVPMPLPMSVPLCESVHVPLPVPLLLLCLCTLNTPLHIPVECILT